jgi:hypothetical protein
MFTRSFAFALLATAIIGGASVNRAEAAAVGTAAASIAIPAGEAVMDVRWICGPSRCNWVAWSPGVQHSWARGWGPPRNPSCHWEKRRGRWRQVCPW